MPSISRRVADSFITTPRAPNWIAFSRSDGWMAAVSRITRGPPALVSAASASTPPMRGIATSSRRMSGCESRAMRIASMPSAPSETTSKPGSLSSSRRRPSRKIWWSSAIEMRTRRGCSGMGSGIQGQLEARADAGRRIDGKLRARDARAFLDDGRTDAPLLHLARREAPLELEPLPVVFDDQRAGVIGVGQPDQHVSRAAVLADVDERLLDDPRQFERGRCGQRDGTTIADEARRDAGVAAEAFHERGEDVGELIARLELDGTERLHQLPERKDLALQQLLHVAELRGHVGRAERRAAAERLDLHLDAEERLDGAVVQLARDARPFDRASARPQTPQQEHVGE